MSTRAPQRYDTLQGKKEITKSEPVPDRNLMPLAKVNAERRPKASPEPQINLAGGLNTVSLRFSATRAAWFCRCYRNGDGGHAIDGLTFFLEGGGDALRWELAFLRSRESLQAIITGPIEMLVPQGKKIYIA